MCSFYWDMEASLAPKDKQIELAIGAERGPGAAAEQFTDEPPVERAGRPRR